MTTLNLYHHFSALASFGATFVDIACVIWHVMLDYVKLW
jgi:hypothetical protein